MLPHLVCVTIGSRFSLRLRFFSINAQGGQTPISLEKRVQVTPACVSNMSSCDRGHACRCLTMVRALLQTRNQNEIWIKRRQESDRRVRANAKRLLPNGLGPSRRVPPGQSRSHDAGVHGVPTEQPRIEARH